MAATWWLWEWLLEDGLDVGIAQDVFANKLLYRRVRNMVKLSEETQAKSLQQRDDRFFGINVKTPQTIFCAKLCDKIQAKKKKSPAINS